MIRDINVNNESDVEAITEIYNHYIRNTIVSFEEEPVTAGDMVGRINNILATGYPWLVAEDEDETEVIGYAYAGLWNSRSAYRHSAEVSVYLSHLHSGKGWGTRLYEALFSNLREKSIHVVIGGISLPNPASVALHEKFGMRQAAHYKEVGFKFNQWIDVAYWQVELT